MRRLIMHISQASSPLDQLQKAAKADLGGGTVTGADSLVGGEGGCPVGALAEQRHLTCLGVVANFEA